MSPVHPADKALPKALRRYVVAQDYARYEPADQATWRFIMLHLVEHLRHRAHPLYLEGLRRTGLSTDHIPRIEEVDEALGALGWRAVCVSGFVPPRAFQRFQAQRILPIAGDIRAPWHVAYTPAPDIVHEAAGHAPLIVDPVYSEYLQKIGELGELAFSSRQDLAVHEAVARLSNLKEATSDSDPSVALAEQHLAQVLADQVGAPDSEAARMSRLYWWTAEYGLVGEVDDFKVYGAGLLSSLGEAVYCESPSVEKRPLDVGCLDVPFDITRPQPQLFVVGSFEKLFDVLADARRQLSCELGVLASLNVARSSGLPCTVELSSSHRLTTVVTAIGESGGRLAWIEGTGDPCLEDGPEHFAPATDGSPRFVLPLGPALSEPSTNALRLMANAQDRLDLTYESGVRISGTVTQVRVSERGAVASLRRAVVTCSGKTYLHERYDLPLGAQVVRVLPDDELAQQAANSVAPKAVVPTVRTLTEHDRALRALYARADNAWRTLSGEEARAALIDVRNTLDAKFPDDWLLRWNLLESLLKLGETQHTAALKRDLERLEDQHARRQPIATGLRSLDNYYSASANDRVEDAS